MIVSVRYTQLNDQSCIRETYHDESLVSVETLEQRLIPYQVQRLMLMTVNRQDNDSLINMLVRLSPEELAVKAGFTDLESED